MHLIIRRLAFLMTATFCVGPLLADRGVPVSFGDPVDLGSPLEDVAVLHCVVGEEEGEAVMYFTTAGEPALFHVVALEDYRLKATYPLPGAERAWSHVMAPDGSVYIGSVAAGGSAHLYRYRPGREKVEDLGAPVAGHKFIWALTSDAEGNIYGGTWEGGHVFRYDPMANQFFDFGHIHPGEDYARSIAWHDGLVYVGTGAKNGRVWRLNPITGERNSLEMPRRSEFSDRLGRMETAYHVQVVGNHLFTFFSTEDRIALAYDLEKEEWWEETFPAVVGPLLGFGSEDGKRFHLITNQGIWNIDLEARQSRLVPGGAGVFRGGGWINLEHPELEGPVFATVNYGGSIRLIDPESGRSIVLPSLAIKNGTQLQALEMGPDGSLYMSGYMGSRGARMDPRSDAIETFPMEQAEGIAFLGSKTYWGIYPHARILTTVTGRAAKPRPVFKIDSHQDRPFAMIPGDGKLFVGTVPGYGRLGGALTVFNPQAKREGHAQVYQDIIPGHSIVGLAWREGKIYGSTSIHGGLGIDPVAREGKVFIWDPEREEVILERELDLPEAGSLRMIGGLSAGPDGLIWGCVNGTIFALDPETLDVRRHRTIYPGIESYGRWRPVYLRWGADGLLYCNPGGQLTVINPVDLDFISAEIPVALFALGSGELYYTAGSRLVRIPLLPSAASSR